MLKEKEKEKEKVYAITLPAQDMAILCLLVLHKIGPNVLDVCDIAHDALHEFLCEHEDEYEPSDVLLRSVIQITSSILENGS